MNIRQAITWITGKMREGYSQFIHHTPDSLTSEEKLSPFIREDTGNCFANSLMYYGFKGNEESSKIINIYHIDLNLSDIETSCQTQNAYTLFSIKNFNSSTDLIDFLDYNTGFDSGCDRLTIHEITPTSTSSGTIQNTWFVGIANSSNSLIVYGDSNFQLTDDHLVC